MNRLTAQQVAVLSLLACAVIINSILYDFMGLPWTLVYFGTLLIIAYLWEGVEVWMEYEVSICELCGWKWGFEHWSNHMVSDPSAMALLGGTIAKKWKNTWKWVLPIFLIWMFMSYCFPATSPNGMHLRHILSNILK